MRKSVATTVPEAANAAPDAIDMGRWLGRREAFSLVAGRCSAAEAESLRQIRERRLYLTVARSWDEFCAKHVGASRRNIERSLRLLEEFGPAYFAVAQMAHIGPEEYRAIAAHVDEGGVRLDGAIVALLPENSGHVAAAVGELLRRAAPPESRAAKAASVEQAIKRCAEAARLLDESEGSPDLGQRMALSSALARMRVAAAARGVLVVG